MQAIQILLVDDEDRFVLNLAKLMKARDFDVFTAFSGEQALDRLSSRKDVAVVLLDVSMPGMNGMETLGRIKARYPHIEVIMLTGRATLEDGVQALRLGAFDYLQKPCDIDVLKSKIGAACSVERIRRHPVLWPRSMAGDIILSGFVPLLSEDTLDRALALFDRYRTGEGARMLFVVDNRLRIQGVLRRENLLSEAARRQGKEAVPWEWMRQHPDCLSGDTVHRIMHRQAYFVTPETSLVETARLMMHHHYDSMPVVSEGAVLGIVRLRDALQYVQAADPNNKGD